MRLQEIIRVLYLEEHVQLVLLAVIIFTAMQMKRFIQQELMLIIHLIIGDIQEMESAVILKSLVE